MDKDFIPLNPGKSRSRIQDQSDVYQDYIDNIDDEYKDDLNRFLVLSLDENPNLDSDSSSSSGSESIYADPGMESPAISKAQIKNARREAKRLRKDIEIQDSLDRHDDTMELVKILSKSKGFLDKSVVEYLRRENQKIIDFFHSDQDSMVLGTMPSAIRDLVQEITNKYHLTTKTRGRAKNKVFVVIKNSGSSIPENCGKIVDQVVKGKIGTYLNINKFWYGAPKVQKKIKGAPNQNHIPKMGDVVGGSAPPLNSDTSIGHAMLLKMGWKQGDSLGDGTGIVEPVKAIVRSKRGGLGAE